MAKLFLWEIKKNVKKKAVIAIGIVLAVMLVLWAIVFNLISFNVEEDGGLIGDLEEQIQKGDLSQEELDGLEAILNALKQNPSKISKEELLELKATTEKELAETEADYADNADSRGYLYGTRYNKRSLLKVVNYALENGYYDKEVNIWGYNYENSNMNKNAENFVSSYAGIVMFVVLIYGIVMGGGMYAGEYKSGTIKMVMTRPVGKNKVTLAKLLSLYASLTVLYCVPVLISFVYGVIAFGSQSMTQVLYAFNSTSAGVTTLGALMFGDIVAQLVKILVLATISFSLGTVTRKSTLGIIVALIISLSISSILSFVGISAFTLSNGFGFMGYFGLGTGVVYLGNFYLCLGVIVFWLAAAIAGTLVYVRKADVN